MVQLGAAEEAICGMSFCLGLTLGGVDDDWSAG